MDEEHTYAAPLRYRGDNLVAEDKDFAVVYNGSIGGTYDVMRKHTEQEVRDHIRRYGIDHASDDVKEVAKDMAAEEFARMAEREPPVFEMHNGEQLYANYNKETDTIDVEKATGEGLAVQHRFPYSHHASMEANLRIVYEKLDSMNEYRADMAEQTAFHR